MTFVRLCCAHVMKGISRSLFKIETSRVTRKQLMTLFAVLLNGHDIDGAFDLYQQIMINLHDYYHHF
jgi:hypothetical protein